MATETLNAKDVILTSRPKLWLITAALFAVGYLTGGLYFNWTLVIGSFYFLFPYCLLLYGLNDIYDYDLDRQNPRKKGKLLAKTKHAQLLILILAINVPYWFYFVNNGGRLVEIWLFLTIFMTAAYSVKSFRFKEIALVDSLSGAFLYSSPFMFGVISVSHQIGWLAAYAVIFIWALGSHAFSKIQDLKPTTKAGSESIATKLGSSKTLVFCLVCFSLAALLPIIIFSGPGLIISLVLLSYVWLAARTSPYRKQSTSVIFQRSWRLLTSLTYVNGLLISLYLVLVYKLSH